MEGHGFLVATHANSNVDALVVRGVSDLIEGKGKADAEGWQERASQHAAAFAFEVLATIDRVGNLTPALASGLGTPSAGGLAPVWNLPYSRNPNFTGREDLLVLMQDTLRAGAPTVLIQPQTLHGLGGIGKTQLAVEFAYRSATSHGIVWWIRAEDPTTIAADLAHLAARLGLPEASIQDQDTVVDAVRRRLERGIDRWMLIFDNAEEPSKLQPFLPRIGTGLVLITSRNPNWLSVGEVLEIDVLTEPEAVTFLLRRADWTDHEAAIALARRLGGLPLALEQAGSFIEATGMSPRDYLQLLELREEGLLGRGIPTNYPGTVASTWELSFRRVEAESPVAADLLKLCSYLDETWS